MCAILFTNKKDIVLDKFKDALLLMSHRGPDAFGVKECGNVKIGHTRLKIIDLDDKANQPFCSKDDRYVMIFNGEIYNYKELSKKYNISTVTSSDTEVLLKLYIKLGKNCLNELNGMFAFIVYDTKTDEIFAARDRLGIKPLYYYKYNHQIIFSSEIAPILKLIDTYEFDEIGIRQYLKLRTFFNGHTIYKNIQMFQAGSYYQNDKFYKYWEFPNIDTQEPPSDDELYELIKSSVDYRCIADVSVGSYLSGGLDSSIISTLASKNDNWSVGFEDNNEFHWANLVAKQQKTKLNKVILDYDDFIPILKKLILKRKEPLSVPNEVLLFVMTKQVKNKNKVVLSGEGADELMFGYDRIFRWASNNQWNLNQFDKLYSYGSHRDDEIVDYIMQPYRKYGSNINMIAAFFQVSHLHGLLRRLDFTTMQNSVEARVPFVDHRIVERMAGVDFEFRMKDGVVKAPLKRIFKSILPKEIIERKKVGFPVELTKIFHAKKLGMDSWLETNIDILKRSLL